MEEAMDRQKRIRLERAEFEIDRALQRGRDESERRRRVLIATRHLIAYLAVGVDESDEEWDADEERTAC